MNYTVLTESRSRIRAFVLGSVILHGAVLAGWHASPWMAGQANSVISVILVPDRTGAAPAESWLTTQYKHKIVRHADNASIDEQPARTTGTKNRLTQEMALLAAPAETKPMSIVSHIEGSRPMEKNIALSEGTKKNNAHDTQRLVSPSAPATGDGDEHGRAKAQIRAQLNADLARYFDYPYVARLRGWEGTVLLGLRVASDGRLDKIRIERSSGYAVLDNSALNSLNRLGQLAEASAWLNGRGLDMQLPVIYRLIQN